MSTSNRHRTKASDRYGRFHRAVTHRRLHSPARGRLATGGHTGSTVAAASNAGAAQLAKGAAPSLSPRATQLLTGGRTTSRPLPSSFSTT